MWIAGITQGLMWRALNDDGTLTYSFIESLKFTYPYYGIRLLGGLVFFSRHACDGLQRLDDGAENKTRTCRGHPAGVR